MLYAIRCYHDQNEVNAWTREEEAALAAALDLIVPLETPLAGYFHYFGVKGALLRQLGDVAATRTAFDRAITLAHTPAEAAHIRQHLDRLSADHPSD